jgi:hypothetical protein
MWKETKNPKIEEITRSFKGRALQLSRYSVKPDENGKRFCFWCGEVELFGSKLRKYCGSECSEAAFAWAQPQRENGLHALLVRQNWKCNVCQFDYGPTIERINAYHRARNILIPNFGGQSSFHYMRRFRKACARTERPEVDHVIAIVLGGASIGLGNHQVLCSYCHKKKTKKDIKEKFAKNGNPRKGIPFTEEHKKAMSESRVGFDSEARKAHREKDIYSNIRKPIVAVKIDSKEEREFVSCAEAAYALGLQESNISRVLRGDQKRTQHKGWTFRYK